MKPVKLGVLGVSKHYGQRVHLPVSKSPLFELTALGSRSAGRSREAAKRWGFARAYGSYKEVVSDSDVEMVYIPLPNDSHTLWIQKCADAGKAVLCEKPLAMNAHQAAGALAYSEDQGILTMEAFMYRFHPQWVRARELIRAGEIGDIVSIHTVFSYFNDNPANIRNRTETGGGALYDIGCYAVSSARFLMDCEPLRVNASIVRDPVNGTDILTSGILDFDGPRAVFTVSTRMTPSQRVEIYGSRGKISVIRPFNAYPDVPLPLEVNPGDGMRTIHCGPADQYGLMFEAFARAFRNGDPAPVPLNDAVANMKVIDALFRSEKTGSWAQV